MARPLKLLAGSLSFFTAVLGAVGTIVGLLTLTPSLILSGTAGTILSVQFLRRMAAPHYGFERAFGKERCNQIQPELASRMLHRRWTWQLPSTPKPRIENRVPYRILPGNNGGPTRQLLCSIWRPSENLTPSGLAVVYLHGGGWRHGFERDQFAKHTRTFFRHLTAQGHLVMVIAYRLYPEVKISDMIADCRHAVVWIKENAEKYSVNSNRVVLAGGSAGGQLALLISYTDGHAALVPNEFNGLDTSVRGVIAFYPPVDLRLHLAHKHTRTLKIGSLVLPSRRDVLTGLLGGTPEEAPEMYDLMSPINHVSSSCPPTLLLHGGHDDVVPVEPVRILHRNLVAASAVAVYVEFPWTEHVFDLLLPKYSPSAQAALYDVERFLALLV